MEHFLPYDSSNVNQVLRESPTWYVAGRKYTLKECFKSGNEEERDRLIHGSGLAAPTTAFSPPLSDLRGKNGRQKLTIITRHGPLLVGDDITWCPNDKNATVRLSYGTGAARSYFSYYY